MPTTNQTPARQTAESRTAPAVALNRLVRAVRVSDKLIETRDGVKRLLGDKWPEKLREIRPAIEQLMAQERSDNPLEVVLPVAKEMSDDGHSPAVLLAVACEMVEPSGPNIPVRDGEDRASHSPST